MGGNVELVEELGRRFRAGDWDGAFELFHADFRIQQPDSLPHGGWHDGPEGMKQMSASFGQYWTRTISRSHHARLWGCRRPGHDTDVDVEGNRSFSDRRRRRTLLLHRRSHRGDQGVPTRHPSAARNPRRHLNLELHRRDQMTLTECWRHGCGPFNRRPGRSIGTDQRLRQDLETRPRLSKIALQPMIATRIEMISVVSPVDPSPLRGPAIEGSTRCPPPAPSTYPSYRS